MVVKLMTDRRMYGGRLLTEEQIISIREQKKLAMRKRRSNPTFHEVIKNQQRKYYKDGGLERQRITINKLKTENFFHWRTRLFNQHYNTNFSKDVFETIWNKQNNRCALTNRILTHSAHIDHIIPLKRGGTHDLNNLRWVCPEVNYAKRNLLDYEFISLCQEVINNK